MMKTVRWLFDYGNEEEEEGVAASSDEDEEGKGDDDKKADYKQADTGKDGKGDENPRSILKEESKHAAPKESKRSSKRLSFGRGGKGATANHEPATENALKESKRTSNSRVSWLEMRRKKDKEKQEKKAAEPKTASKRTSWRNSFDKRSKGSTSERARDKASKDLMLSNLGAINEDGEYAQAKLEDSNIVGIGGKEDRELRKEAAATDKAFKKAGQKKGIEIWRVENKRTKKDNPDFGIKRWPKEEYGSFYSGDSYIVLNTYHPQDPLSGKADKRKLAWDLHFWLGSESSQDEITVAAYKTVELDTLLDDAAVQHRETQYHESKLFLSYFKELNYMSGGIESGFRRVRPTEYEPRLLMVRHVSRVTKSYQIPCSSKYMNHGDCFILDTGLVVYRWIGSKSNFFEKNKSGLLQHNIVNSRNGKAVKADADEEFWKIVGSEADVRSDSNPYEVETGPNQRLDATSVRLFRISDETGALAFSLEAEGKVPIWKLDSNDVFLVHSNVGIWIWIGAGSTKQERSQSMHIADEYLKKEGLPNTMTVTAISESNAKSNALFQGLFCNAR